MLEHDPQAILARAELLCRAEEVNTVIATLASAVNQHFQGKQPVVLGVMTGGLYLLGQLLPRLDFPLTLDYVHATRYNSGTAGAALTWRVPPSSAIAGRDVLIVDDILDEGITLQGIVQACQSLGALSVKTAVLVDKQLPHIKPMHADYVGLSVPNYYVFGCGMDAYGWWRNLPAIYILHH